VALEFNTGDRFVDVHSILDLGHFGARSSERKRKRINKDGSKYVVENDGYYFGMYIFLSFFAVINIAVASAAIFGSRTSVSKKAMVIEACSFGMIYFAQKIAIQATDRRRFSLFMLVLYIQVDLTQTILFLQVPISPQNSSS
jgi:hypothetical protein